MVLVDLIVMFWFGDLVFEGGLPLARASSSIQEPLYGTKLIWIYE